MFVQLAIMLSRSFIVKLYGQTFQLNSFIPSMLKVTMDCYYLVLLLVCIAAFIGHHKEQWIIRMSQITIKGWTPSRGIQEGPDVPGTKISCAEGSDCPVCWRLLLCLFFLNSVTTLKRVWFVYCACLQEGWVWKAALDRSFISLYHSSWALKQPLCKVEISMMTTEQCWFCSHLEWSVWEVVLPFCVCCTYFVG